MQKALLFGGMFLAAMTLLPLHALATDTEEIVNTEPVISEEQTDETILTGWQTVNNRFYYYDAEGVPVTGITEIDGFSYFFAPNGALQTGWQSIGDNRFYYSPQTGRPQFGALDWRGETYYIDPENGKITNQVRAEEEGSRYYNSFGYAERSKMLTLDTSEAIYVNDEGYLATGLTEIDDRLYYFNENGIRQSGWQQIDEKLYYFEEHDGSATFGWLTLDGENGTDTFYSDQESGRYTGLQEVDGKQYYFAENGAMQKGLQTIEGDRYYFDENGVMLTGIHLVPGGAIYGFDESGKMLYGFQVFDGKQYYFAENGTMQMGLVLVDGVPYAFNQDGVLGNGWTIRKTEYYYCDAEGHPLSGWQEIEGEFYFFDETTYQRLTSTQVEDYILDENGVAKSTLYRQVEELLDDSGTTPYSIYSYVTSHYRYRKIEATRTRSQLDAAGWDTLVSYTLKNKKGVCYYLAATMDYFMRLAGYETRLVHAHHSTGDHYWNQVLVDGKWLNYDPTYTNRGNIAWDRIISLGNYTVYGYVTIQYDAKGQYLGTEFTSY